MPSPPPTDILWAILEHMKDDKQGLATLCRVSWHFREVAESVLYRRIELPLPAITPVCIALATHPHLALHVRHFETSKNPGWKPRNSTHLLHMRNALRRMQGLRILRIHFSGPLAWILEDCYFSELRSMLCNLSCDHHLASFLRRQTQLIDITLSSIHHDHFPCFIDRACVPSLTRISADPVWLEMLVPNHPISDIDIWDFRDTLVSSADPDCTIDWLSLSLTSVMILSVSEAFLISRGAGNVASLVPHLRHLKIKCNTLNLFSEKVGVHTTNYLGSALKTLPKVIEERIIFTAWLSISLGYFRSLDTMEVILRGWMSPVDIEDLLIQNFVVDASERALDLRDFIMTFTQQMPATDTKITWRRHHEEWSRSPSSGDDHEDI